MKKGIHSAVKKGEVETLDLLWIFPYLEVRI